MPISVNQRRYRRQTVKKKLIVVKCDDEAAIENLPYIHVRV